MARSNRNGLWGKGFWVVPAGLALVLILGLGGARKAGAKGSHSILLSVGALRASVTEEEWKTSPVHSSEVFSEILQGSVEEQAAACEEFGGLPDGDLAVFDHELRQASKKGSATGASNLPCLEDLMVRLNHYWESQRKTLESKVGDPEKARLSGHSGGLSSIEVKVNLSSGELLSSAGLTAGQIALTFDDGPSEDHSLDILDILNRWGIRATYFEVGENADRFPSISEEIMLHDHSVGSHTYSHPKLTALSYEEAVDEIGRGRAAVARATGMGLDFFRFPYGAMNAALKSYLQSEKVANFFWSMDSLDWKYTDVSELYNNVLAELDREGKGIILFHDIHPQTVAVLPSVLSELARRKFSTVVFK